MPICLNLTLKKKTLDYNNFYKIFHTTSCIPQCDILVNNVETLLYSTICYEIYFE